MRSNNWIERSSVNRPEHWQQQSKAVRVRIIIGDTVERANRRTYSQELQKTWWMQSSTTTRSTQMSGLLDDCEAEM